MLGRRNQIGDREWLGWGWLREGPSEWGRSAQPEPWAQGHPLVSRVRVPSALASGKAVGGNGQPSSRGYGSAAGPVGDRGAVLRFQSRSRILSRVVGVV